MGGVVEMRSILGAISRRHGSAVMAGGIGLAALLLYMAVPREPAHFASRSPVRTTVIVVARHTIAAGAVIVPADLKSQLSTAGAEAGVISSANVAVGRISTKAVAAGQPLLESNLQDSATVGIAARVPPGERAFSIRVMEDEIVGGFLQSGNRVDIFATIPGSVFPQKEAPGTADRSRAVLLLQNVRVLAVGENSATRGAIQSGARTVSFSLTPEQLARLTLALRFGKVSLAVRNPADVAVTNAASASLTDLLPATPDRAAPAPTVHPRRPVVPLLLGTKTIDTFADGRS
jgi:pilus assembly protein CpaB